jgi:hypothetical protein
MPPASAPARHRPTSRLVGRNRTLDASSVRDPRNPIQYIDLKPYMFHRQALYRLKLMA